MHILKFCRLFLHSCCFVKRSVNTALLIWFQTKTLRKQGLKKNLSGRPGQVDFPIGQVTISSSLPNGQCPRQAVRRLNLWLWFWEEKVSFRLKGNQVFTWSLTKITIHSVDLLIAWRALIAQRWLPSTWSKSAPIKFLSRIKIAAIGTKCCP